MCSAATKMFSTLLLSNKQKALGEINNEAKETGKQIKADLFLDKVSQFGFTLDKEQPTQLSQFIHAIDSLVQLKLTGDHVVTLYNQRLELSFNSKSVLTDIKLI